MFFPYAGYKASKGKPKMSEELEDTIRRATKFVEQQRVKEEIEARVKRGPVKSRPASIIKIGQKDRARIMADQIWMCPVCGCDLDELPDKHVHVDHNHESGDLRGIVCIRCNLGLGYLKADQGTRVLERAIAYLNRPPISNVKVTIIKRIDSEEGDS